MMVKVVGVRFRTAGKIYFFDPGRLQIGKGDHVIVETARGIEFGTVVGEPREIDEEKVVQPLKQVLRIATERDKEQESENRRKEKEAYQICLEKINRHGLEMKLIDAEYTFDNNKVLFYFTADGRIDFRELVKDLASVFKTRIELRQIGVRDETKTVGGIGICGRALCCHSYLSDFIPVSIKMAKEQNLSLNPAKISGVCGRLMCCLKYEEETYEELNRKLPNVGDSVITEDGLRGEVQSVNVLRQLVKVVVETNDEKEIKEYEANKLKFHRKHGKRDRSEAGMDELTAADALSREELKELALLEKEEDQEIAEREEKAEYDGRQNDRENRAISGSASEKKEWRNRSRGNKGERQEKEAASGNAERRAEGRRTEDRGAQDRGAQDRGTQDRKAEDRKPEDRRSYEHKSENQVKRQQNTGNSKENGALQEENGQTGRGQGRKNGRGGRNKGKGKSTPENGGRIEQNGEGNSPKKSSEDVNGRKRDERAAEQGAGQETANPKAENRNRKDYRRRPSRQRHVGGERIGEAGGNTES